MVRPKFLLPALALLLSAVPAQSQSPAPAQSCPAEVLRMLQACGMVGGCVVIPQSEYVELLRRAGIEI